jgi:hypothetical protein
MNNVYSHRQSVAIPERCKNEQRCHLNEVQCWICHNMRHMLWGFRHEWDILNQTLITTTDKTWNLVSSSCCAIWFHYQNDYNTWNGKHSFIFYKLFRFFVLATIGPPMMADTELENVAEDEWIAISSAVFNLITKSDVDETWAKAYQLDLKQQSSKWWNPHSPWWHKRSTDSKVFLTAIQFQSQTVNAQHYNSFLQYHPHHAETQKHLQLTYDANFLYEDVTVHSADIFKNAVRVSSQKWNTSLPVLFTSVHVTVMIPKLNESLRRRTICIQGGHSNSSSVRGGTD